MFSKTRVTELGPQSKPAPDAERAGDGGYAPGLDEGTGIGRSRPAPSVLSADLSVTGNIETQGDALIEGQVEGDIRAHQLTIGESATIRGEIVAEDIVVNGRVVGRVRGLKVRLAATARVEGDIVHKTIAIESGAHFEGSVKRQEDPLQTADQRRLAPPSAHDGAQADGIGSALAPEDGEA